MIKKLGLKLKEQKGFTLIELLAVIVILGIIAAIAIPAIGNVISKSDTKAKAQEGVQIINAAKLYVANNNITVTSTLDVTNSQLREFLDRTNDKGTTFKVVVTKGATSAGKYSYSLVGHESVPSGDTDGLTEQELVDLAE
ncbi:MAG: prepilin-type N-terminal cleavage/methylation domain-containing protein [Neobacillus sp.]